MGGGQRTLREPTQPQGEHANPTQNNLWPPVDSNPGPSSREASVRTTAPPIFEQRILNLAHFSRPIKLTVGNKSATSLRQKTRTWTERPSAVSFHRAVFFGYSRFTEGLCTSRHFLVYCRALTLPSVSMTNKWKRVPQATGRCSFPPNTRCP